MDDELDRLANRLDAALSDLVRGDRSTEEVAAWRLNDLLVALDGAEPRATWSQRVADCVGRNRR